MYMAVYTNLPIYKLSYTFALEITKMYPNLPRDCRYSMAQQMRQRVLDLIVLIFRASRSKDKVLLISEMREVTVEIQVYCRLMKDMKYITDKKYVSLIDYTEMMSKQLSSWENSERGKMGGVRLK